MPFILNNKFKIIIKIIILYQKMAKFGKKLRQRKIKEWEENYIDYKGLKHFIKTNNDPSKIKFI